jgi:hypothetical protein
MEVDGAQGLWLFALVSDVLLLLWLLLELVVQLSRHCGEFRSDVLELLLSVTGSVPVGRVS